MRHHLFWMPHLKGVRALGWQLDYRSDGWLPLGVRYGWNAPGFLVLRLGRFGCITLGRVSR